MTFRECFNIQSPRNSFHALATTVCTVMGTSRKSYNVKSTECGCSSPVTSPVSHAKHKGTHRDTRLRPQVQHNTSKCFTIIIYPTTCLCYILDQIMIHAMQSPSVQEIDFHLHFQLPDFVWTHTSQPFFISLAWWPCKGTLWHFSVFNQSDNIRL